MKPSISVVIPVLNDARLLELCLLSLERQTRAADEIIVVDNNSTDDSAAVAAAFGATVIRELRPGITAAASAGYDHATSDIIARCDADSVLPREWLHRIERDLAARPDAVAVTGPGRFYDLHPSAARVADIVYMKAYFALTRAALASTPLFGSNFALRAHAWREVSDAVPRDLVGLHDDIDLSFRLSPAQTVLFDRRLVVGISGRPFHSLASMVRRTKVAATTMALHWPAELPPVRWWRRLARR